MRSKNIIEVRELSKCFISSGAVETDTNLNLREKIPAKIKELITFNKAKTKPSTSEPKEFWALKDVSFDIERGSRVGILGQNGAGKSTLLKILSRITAPTKGKVHVKDKLVSLLEIGAGFHPELTGRENIFLNGVILGMKRAEVKKRFDEIIAFAEIEEFLDMPVKKYSTGMYMRLAFAVAAHLDPEIFIIDEMLAVGDAAFQKKCLTRMEQLSKADGRTILLVSHSIEAIRHLCDTALFLQKGKLMAEGKAATVIDQYVRSFSPPQEFTPNVNKPVYVNNITLSKSEIVFGQSFLMQCEIMSDVHIDNYVVGFGISNNFDFRFASALMFSETPLKKGRNIVEIDVPVTDVVPGEYKLSFAIANYQLTEIIDVVAGYPEFKILPDENNQYLLSKWHPSWGHNILRAAFL